MATLTTTRTTVTTATTAQLPWIPSRSASNTTTTTDSHHHHSVARSTTHHVAPNLLDPHHPINPLDLSYRRALIAQQSGPSRPRTQPQPHPPVDSIHRTPVRPPSAHGISHQRAPGVTPPQSVVVPDATGTYKSYRSKSLPLSSEHTMMMMASGAMEGGIADTAPDSPPDLTYSKSSKSSSSLNSDDDLCSSDMVLTKAGHFEEVVLEDVGTESVDDSNLPAHARPTLRRPIPRSLTSDHVTRPRGGTSPPLRPLPNGVRQKYPTLGSAGSEVLRVQSLNLPTGRTTQNRTASSPTSSLMRQHSQRASSRSPSPNKPFVNGTSPSSTPKVSYESSSSLQRRTSWQPGRKTVEELEAEYNDEDEEVPDEAILENVPISPLPGHYSTAKSPNLNISPGGRSTTPSPHRRPYANLHSANIPKGAKRPSAPPINGMPRSPKGRPPLMPHSATVPSFPANPFGRKHRSKSWTDHLNHEAKELSQKLEEYAERLSLERKEESSSGTSSAAGSPPRSVMAMPRARTSLPLPTVPPLQKGNIMIDPLPISKEKEAVLTRTRPSWLPPKSQKEERKHLKEFQQMMARAAEAEKKRLLKAQENHDTKQEMQGSIARIWEQHVLPNWDVVIREPRTRELWWRGVTPRSRGEVWQKAIGNELELSPGSFDAALARAHAMESKVHDLSPEERANSKEAAWLDAIARDVPNTFPETRIYEPGAAHHKSLADVLKAYAMYRSDIGYVYGTHLIAGIVCLLLRPAEAFVLLANMMNRPVPLAFLVHDQPAMQRTYDNTLQTLKYKFTKLHDHLTNPALGLKPEEFLDPIFRCLFSYNLPPEHVSRIWDVFAFEGDKALIRAAVAILGRLESKLYGGREEILELIGWQNERRWDLGSEDEFMSAVREAGKVDVHNSA